MMHSLILYLLTLVISLVNAQCNPMKSICQPIPGLANSSYSIDFTQQRGQPSEWTLADYAVVKYGANGADFTFNKRFDAPYIWSSFYLLFGRVEVVLKAAPGTGIITGAVLMSDTLDEIDWEWSGNNFGSPSGKVQTNYFGKGVTGNYDRGTQPPVDIPSGQFHTYVLDWTPDSLTWSIDGKVVRTLKGNSATTGAYQYPQTPSRFHLGIWNGGDPDSNPGVVQWAGGYTDFSKAPFTAYVKSVKITTPYPCSSWQYPQGFSGKWQDVKCLNTSISVTTKTTSSATSTPSILPCTYTVLAGDYGYAIAVKLGIPFGDLRDANRSVDWDKLIVGQSLKVPGGQCSTSSTVSVSGSSVNTTAAPSTQTMISSSTMSNLNSNITSSAQLVTYTIAPGDYGYKIAEKLGCSFPDLQKVNPGIDWDKLLLGQVLNVPFRTLNTNTASITSSNTVTSNPFFEVPVAHGTTQSLPNSSPAHTSCDSSTSSSLSITPVMTSSPSKCLTYTVGASDYGYKIADGFGISFETLEKANPGVIWDKLLIGQILTIPTGVTTRPSTGVGETVCRVATSSSISKSSTTTMTMTIATTTTSTITKPLPSTSSSPNAQSTSTTPPPKPTTTPSNTTTTTKLVCNRDNCLNNLLDPRYLPSLRAYCPLLLTTQSSPSATLAAFTPQPAIPTYLSGCQGKIDRIKSACACLISLSPTPSPPAAAGVTTSTSTSTSTSSLSVIPIMNAASSTSGSSAVSGGLWARLWRW